VNDPATGKFLGKYRTVVRLEEKDEQSQPVTIEHTPESAVRRLKEIPGSMNLFKSGVVSGLGSNSNLPVGGGKLDVRKLSPQQYAKIRAENPELLGLRRNKQRKY
jgi:hypothetical protein